jgi:hypothetical protein
MNLKAATLLLASFLVLTSNLGQAQPDEECPEPADGDVTDDIAPVTCGEAECEYDNLSLALLANFTEADCVATGATTGTEPPATNGTTATPEEEEEEEEEGGGEPEEEGGGEEGGGTGGGTCPMPDEGAATFVAPVSCGEDECVYDNISYAKLAGFNETECQAKICPKPTEEGAVTSDLSKVVCDDCVYDNLSIAVLAGFAEAACGPVSDDMPIRTSIGAPGSDNTTEFDPNEDEGSDLPESNSTTPTTSAASSMTVFYSTSTTTLLLASGFALL